MLCEMCKLREANIKYMEVMNGVKTEHNLCSKCAKEMDLGSYSAMFDGEFPLGQLLSSLLGITDTAQTKEDSKSIACPTCKTTYDEFAKNSRFGCGDCYSVFDLLMGDSIKQLQGSDRHIGKRPKVKTEPEYEQTISSLTPASDDYGESLLILNAHLQEALKTEKYELAAKYRDQIKELKKENTTNA